MIFRKKLSLSQSISLSVVVAFVATVVFFVYLIYPSEQASIESSSIGFVLRDVANSIRIRKTIPDSMSDIEEALSQASAEKLVVVQRFVEFDFKNPCDSGSRFVVPKPAVGWMDYRQRSYLIEEYGEEIQKEIRLLCSE